MSSEKFELPPILELPYNIGICTKIANTNPEPRARVVCAKFFTNTSGLALGLIYTRLSCSPPLYTTYNFMKKKNLQTIFKLFFFLWTFCIQNISKQVKTTALLLNFRCSHNL